MHQRSRVCLFLFAASLSSGRVLLAQATPAPANDPARAAVAIGEACGLHDDDTGNPFGIGPDYQVRFLSHGFEFVPVLGKAAPHDLPLGLALTHVGRGEPVAVGAARRERHPLRIDYVRPGLVERLDVRRDGLEQSFCFTALPPGDGDLVVRLCMQTELRVAPGDAARGVTLSWPGTGGVHIGGVVGIDARGRRCAGTLRVRGGELDYVLPAAFVAEAALPLVLDPLLSPVVIVSNAAADERQVSVARLGPGSPLSAVVYRRTTSAANDDAFVVIVNDNGTVTGTFTLENATIHSADRPRVAAATATNAWLAVWGEDGDIICRRVTSTGVSNTVALAAGTGTEVGAVVAGAGPDAPSRVFVAWLDSTADSISGCEVNITPNVAPQKQATSLLLTDSGLFTNLVELELPRTSDTSRRLLAYTVRSTVTNQIALRGLFFGSATPIVAMGSSFAIAGSSNSTATAPAVAGDGRTFVVAYRMTSTLVGNAAACVAVHQNGTAAVLATPRPLVTNGTDITDLDVAWAGGSALVAMSRVNGSFHDVLLQSIDPLNCNDCEGLFSVDLAGNDSGVGVAADENGNAAVVWAPITGGQGNVSLLRFRADDGAQATVGDGPFGTNVAATCARVGRADFGIELHGGAANSPAFGLLAAARIDAPCGLGNVVVPDVLGGFVVGAGNTSAVGDLRLPLPIPNDPSLSGLGLFAQFAKPGTSCFGAFDLSAAVQFAIQ